MTQGIFEFFDFFRRSALVCLWVASVAVIGAVLFYPHFIAGMPVFLTLAAFSVVGGIALLVLRYEANGVRMAIDDSDLRAHERKVRE